MSLTGPSVPHESAVKHVTGRAAYTDDLPEPQGTLYAYLGLSHCARGRIAALNLAPVRAAEGVVAVLTAADIPGSNNISPTGLPDEPVFAQDEVRFWGQPLFVVVAESRDAARRAAELAEVSYEAVPPAVSIAEARAAGYPNVTAPLTLRRGDSAQALAEAPHRIAGQMTVGGQDHMYLEGQIAFAHPGEDEDVLVYSSTQHPSETQHMIAHVLGVPSHSVRVEVRRMGGRFWRQRDPDGGLCRGCGAGGQSDGAPGQAAPGPR